MRILTSSGAKGAASARPFAVFTVAYSSVGASVHPDAHDGVHRGVQTGRVGIEIVSAKIEGRPRVHLTEQNIRLVRVARGVTVLHPNGAGSSLG
jgi:hypothetical protein